MEEVKDMKKGTLLIVGTTFIILIIYFLVIIGCIYTDICENPFFPFPISIGIGVWLYLQASELKKFSVFWGSIGFFGTLGYIYLMLYLFEIIPYSIT